MYGVITPIDSVGFAADDGLTGPSAILDFLCYGLCPPEQTRSALNQIMGEEKVEIGEGLAYPVNLTEDWVSNKLHSSFNISVLKRQPYIKLQPTSERIMSGMKKLRKKPPPPPAEARAALTTLKKFKSEQGTDDLHNGIWSMKFKFKELIVKKSQTTVLDYFKRC
ncbi:hypothetical protein ElyMa_004692200 [Elysia marginata]|uniref:Uncharacterized protein n=1 Tax=Elysia marginata TaxID=1093978 RepID=A0AAV4I8G6_9GAST|nr:hypothetical protein ElyMa_004692200 [Elysia marginata]